MADDEPIGAVQFATDALQAIEKLNWSIRNESSSQYTSNVLSTAHTTLDSLRSLKSALEKSDQDFVGPFVSEDELLELKQLTLMHIPSSLTPEAREKFTTLVQTVLKDEVQTVVSITLLTCPWYQASQKERGEMAKHNILLVIFLSHDSQFFSPANPQVKEKASVIDFGWFCAIELSHFGQALGRGRTRYVEAVYCRDGAEIYGSPHWDQLKKTLDYNTATGTKSFQEACLGQAVGGISKKRKDGHMRLREGATIFEICESFRLAQHADNTLRLKASHPDLKEESLLSSTANLALTTIRSFYDHPDPIKCKHDLFDHLMTWVKELRSIASSVKGVDQKACQTDTENVLEKWLLSTRLQGRVIQPDAIVSDPHSELVTLMQKVGRPVSSMRPEHVVLVALAGSSMYNLNTPSSDLDYLIVYRIPTQTLLSSTKKLPECHESRGVDKEVEYGAYEVRTFCEMLLKCSVVILELLFSDEHKYMSLLWKELSSHKNQFVTEKAVQQYLGLIKNNFKLIDKGRHSDAPKRDRKLFYQIFHKLHSLNSMMNGEIPEVRVEGDTRDFIMNVRTQDTGEWSRENLLKEARQRYDTLREKLCARKARLRENPDYELCTKWLLQVRGL